MVGVAPHLSLLPLYIRITYSVCVSVGVVGVGAVPVVAVPVPVDTVAAATITQVHRSKTKHHTNILSPNLEEAL